MRKIITLVALAVLAVCAGCRTNNGDIGYYYGLWVMQSIEADGAALDIDASQYSWRFQNNIIQLTCKRPVHDFMQTNGTWQEADGKLTIKMEPGWEWIEDVLLLPTGVPVVFDIEHLDNKLMVLYGIGMDGHAVRYRLKKLN